MPFDADVIITGAGPAGCAAAIRLADAGHSVLMIERDAFDSGPDLTSGEVLALQTQIECTQLGIDLHAPWVFDRLQFVRNVFPDLSWTLHHIPDGMGHVHVDRGGLNAALRARAKAAGATLICNATATTLEVSTDSVVVRTREGRELQASVLVDASGRNGLALNALSLKEPEPEFQQIGVAVFYASFKGTPLYTWDRHLYGEQGAMISGSRIREGSFRYILEADLVEKQSRSMKPIEFYEHVAARFDPWLAERIGSEPRIGKTWAMAPLAYRASRIAGDRVLLIGDAAGYLSPITGQGIEFAMRMGRLAATTLIDAFRNGDLTAGAFNPYLEGRQAEVLAAVAIVRQQLRLFRDRDALLRAAHDDEFLSHALLPLPIVDRGSLA